MGQAYGRGTGEAEMIEQGGQLLAGTVFFMNIDSWSVFIDNRSTNNINNQIKVVS